MAVGAGARNQRISIEAETDVDDGKGGQTTTWTLRATPYAKEDQLSQSETIAAGQLTGGRLTAWILPFREDVRVTDRVRVGTRTMYVTGVTNPDGRRIETRITCTETAT